MKLESWIAGALGIIVLSAIVVVFTGTPSATSPTSVDANPLQLSGTVGTIENNLMPTAPCHFMGGQYMGDCQVREIEIEARQYDWSVPEIRVQSGELVRLLLTTRDIEHGLAIAEVDVNVNIMPGEVAQVEFIAPAPGEYPFTCSVYCGAGHGDHQGMLVVV